jgi:hypothetical protein
VAASDAGLTVSAPELRRGVAATVVGTLADDDIEAFVGVELSLTVPSGWTLTPASARFDRIEPGDSARVAWTVTARPAATTSGPASTSAAATQDVGVVVCSHASALGRAVFDGLRVT